MCSLSAFPFSALSPMVFTNLFVLAFKHVLATFDAPGLVIWVRLLFSKNNAHLEFSKRFALDKCVIVIAVFSKI